MDKLWSPWRSKYIQSFKPGSGPLFEIPIPVFPYLKLPAATGIMTRVVGTWWTKWTLSYYLKKHDALYYFHPYEMVKAPEVEGLKFMQKLHTRRSGPWMKSAVRNILTEFKNFPVTNCFELMNSFKDINPNNS